MSETQPSIPLSKQIAAIQLAILGHIYGGEVGEAAEAGLRTLRASSALLDALEKALKFISEECRDWDGAEEIPGVNDITATIRVAIAAAKEAP